MTMIIIKMITTIDSIIVVAVGIVIRIKISKNTSQGLW